VSKIVTVDVEEGELIRIGRKRKLNGNFIPVSCSVLGCTLFRVMKELPSGTLRFLLGLLETHDGDHVRYVPVSKENNVHYRLLELNLLLRRLSADQHPRRPGHTTVLISPYVIATRNSKMIDLWDRTNPVSDIRSDDTAQ
jgi:hypothetical protein